MRGLKILAFMLLGAVVMVGCLLWVSQFFNLKDDTTPVIWIENLQQGNGDEKLDAQYEGD